MGLGVGANRPTNRRLLVLAVHGLVLCLASFEAAKVSNASSAVDTSIPPSSPSKSLGLAGAPNFRDIGGYATVDGHHVRWRRVYRSSELSHLTPDDARKVDSLGLATVVDLRTAHERDAAPSAWLHPPRDIFASSKETLAPVMHLILDDAGTAGGAHSGMIKFYTQAPDMYRAEYAAMFHRIAAGDLPILIHCSAGKDRTGVAIAVLLTSIGVPRKAVIDDYELTERLVPEPPVSARGGSTATGAGKAQDAFSVLPEESRRALWRADPVYIEAALDSIDREYGSSDAYIERGLGLSKTDIDKVRASLLE